MPLNAHKMMLNLKNNRWDLFSFRLYKFLKILRFLKIYKMNMILKPRYNKQVKNRKNKDLIFKNRIK